MKPGSCLAFSEAAQHTGGRPDINTAAAATPKVRNTLGMLPELRE